MGREATVARENYCPTGGCVIRLDRISVTPPRAHAGDTLLLSTSYTLLTPEQIAIPVTITREIFFQEKSMGKARSRMPAPWQLHDQIDFKIPILRRSYTLVTVISTGYGRPRKSGFSGWMRNLSTETRKAQSFHRGKDLGCGAAAPRSKIIL
jgi:hypothetical protein